MAKITMHQELEELRREVEELRIQKKEQAKAQEVETLREAALEQQEQEEVQEQAEELMESIESGELEVKESISTLINDAKEQYKNLSPLTAVALFALGTMFGRSISK